MFLTRTFFKLFKVMNSETAAESLAAALALGTFLGFIPLFTLQAILGLLVVIFLRVNVTLGLATMLGVTVLASSIEGSLHELGVSLLDREGLLGLWSFLDSQALFSAMRLTNSIVLGGTVIGALLLLPVGVTGWFLVRIYRDRIEGWVLKSRAVTVLRSMKIFNLYRSVTAPFG